MLNNIRENIENAQEQAKQKLSLILDNMGYKLVTHILNTDGIETRIYQWKNPENGHCIQLIWDGKEDWFDLGEFQHTDNFNYLNASQVVLVPVKRTKLISRKNYMSKKIGLLIEALKEMNNHNR